MTGRRSAVRAPRPDGSSLLEDLRTAAPFPALRSVPAIPATDDDPALDADDDRAFGAETHGAFGAETHGAFGAESASLADELAAVRGVVLTDPAEQPPALRALPGPTGGDDDAAAGEAAEVPFRYVGRPPRPARGTTPEMRLSWDQRWATLSAHPLGDASGLVVAVGPLRVSIAMA